jgi:hypothetical protein
MVIAGNGISKFSVNCSSKPKTTGFSFHRVYVFML